MKKIVSLFFVIAAVSNLYSQSLEEIVRRQAQALKEDNYNNIQTLKITGSINQMGMALGMTNYYKAPDKSKVVISFSGQEIIQVFDGTKGYMINPMAGNTPQELPADQADNLKNNSSYKSPLTRYLAEKKLTLEGTENVNDKPAFKIKAVDGANTIYFFIDKSTWLPVRTSLVSGGMTVDTYQEWAEIKGLMLPKTSKTKSGVMEIIMTIENAEVNIPLEESFFKI